MPSPQPSPKGRGSLLQRHTVSSIAGPWAASSGEKLSGDQRTRPGDYRRRSKRPTQSSYDLIHGRANQGDQQGRKTHASRQLLNAAGSVQPIHAAQFGGEIIFVVVKTRVVIGFAPGQTHDGFVRRNTRGFIVMMNYMRQFAIAERHFRESKLGATRRVIYLQRAAECLCSAPWIAVFEKALADSFQQACIRCTARRRELQRGASATKQARVTESAGLRPQQPGVFIK